MGNIAGVLVAPYASTKRARVPRAFLAVALGITAALSPRVLGRDWPIFTTVIAFGACAGFFRVLSLVHRPNATAGARVASAALLMIDPRRIVRAPRTLTVTLLVTGLIEVAMAVALFLSCDFLPPEPLYSRASVLRVLVGATSAYFIVDGCARLAETIADATGFPIGDIHDAPIRAGTVAEFWGRRWNRAVHRLLSDDAFRPVAKRFGVAAGVMAAFFASAVLHLVPISVAFDVRWGLVMGAFFVAHGIIVLVEAKLGVARWPKVVRHAWTLSWFAVTMPLFVEPMLRSMGK